MFSVPSFPDHDPKLAVKHGSENTKEIQCGFGQEIDMKKEENPKMIALLSTCAALEHDLGFTPTNLGVCSLTQTMAFALFSPMWARLAEECSRKWMLGIGCMMWGLCTIGLAVASDFYLIVALRFLNGIALASLGPIATATLSEITREERRGFVFGLVSSSKSCGRLVGGFLTTIFALQIFFGSISGWRVVFFVVGVSSIMLGVIVIKVFDAINDHVHTDTPAQPNTYAPIGLSLSPSGNAQGPYLRALDTAHGSNAGVEIDLDSMAPTTGQGSEEYLFAVHNSNARRSQLQHPLTGGIAELESQTGLDTYSGLRVKTSGSSSASVDRKNPSATPAQNPIFFGGMRPDACAVTATSAVADRLFRAASEAHTPSLLTRRSAGLMSPAVYGAAGVSGSGSNYGSGASAAAARRGLLSGTDLSGSIMSPSFARHQDDVLFGDKEASLDSLLAAAEMEGEDEDDHDDFVIVCTGHEIPLTGPVPAPPSSYTPPWRVKDLMEFFWLPSVIFIGIVEIFIGIPWGALTFVTFWLQYLGLTDSNAALVVSVQLISIIIMSPVAGKISDYANVRSPATGRAMVAQVALFLRLPVLVLLFLWAPGALYARPGETSAASLALDVTGDVTAASLGLTQSADANDSLWTLSILCLLSGSLAALAGATNRPLITELVGPSYRTSTLAWIDCVEICVRAVLGAPLVGLLAEWAFDFHPSTMKISEMDPLLRKQNAYAIGQAMALCVVVPSVLALVFFTPLHYTLQKDKQVAYGIYARQRLTLWTEHVTELRRERLDHKRRLRAKMAKKRLQEAEVLRERQIKQDVNLLVESVPGAEMLSAFLYRANHAPTDATSNLQATVEVDEDESDLSDVEGEARRLTALVQQQQQPATEFQEHEMTDRGMAAVSPSRAQQQGDTPLDEQDDEEVAVSGVSFGGHQQQF